MQAEIECGKIPEMMDNFWGSIVEFQLLLPKQLFIFVVKLDERACVRNQFSLSFLASAGSCFVAEITLTR
jgi:hypothetical protein